MIAQRIIKHVYNLRYLINFMAVDAFQLLYGVPYDFERTFFLLKIMLQLL
jgi:hypothetical protein